MGIKNHEQNDQQFEKIIADLKNLPKIGAPDDFEFKLMIRVQNGQFDSKEISKRQGSIWGFIPATAIALSAIIIFFIVQETSVEYDNPYNLETAKQYDVALLTPDTININSNRSEASDGNYMVVLQPNDAVKKEKINRPAGQKRGESVDSYLGGKRNRDSFGNGAQLVTFPKRGFYIPNESNIREIEKLKARMDSLTNGKTR